MNTVRFAAPFIIVSFLISLLLLIGRIDPDFFAYYYVGRAVVWGRDMFADVAESKGPVTYLFFATLYWLFGRHYGPGIVIASTVLDAINGMLLLSLLSHWLSWKPSRHKWAMWGLAVPIVMYVKSFSINTLQGGVYSEQIAFPFLLSSLLLVEKRYSWAAGVSFGIAVLARQSLAGYLLLVFIRLFILRQYLIHGIRFLSGLGVVIGCFVLILWLNGQWYWAMENMIVSVRWYSQTTMSERLPGIFRVLLREIRLLFAMIFVVFFHLRCWSIMKRKKITLTILGLLLSGVGSVFAGALVWDHHFIQMAPLFITCFAAWALYAQKDYVLQLFLGIVVVAVFIGYAGYGLIGSQIGQRLVDEIPPVAEIASKRYIVVYGLSPRVYIDYEKESPDRNYNPDFSLNRKYLGDYTTTAISSHLKMGEEKARATAFVFFSDVNTNSSLRYQWYLDLIRDPFHAAKQADYRFGSTRMEVYGWTD